MTIKVNKDVKKESAVDVLSKAAATTTQKKSERKIKPSDNYLRVDLKPEGYDLKAYINKRVGELSVERDKKVSSTAYIQELIIKDMNEKKPKTTKKDIIKSLIDKMSDREVAALETLINMRL